MENEKQLLDALHIVAIRLHDNQELLKQMVRMTEEGQRTIHKTTKAILEQNLTNISQQT